MTSKTAKRAQRAKHRLSRSKINLAGGDTTTKAPPRTTPRAEDASAPIIAARIARMGMPATEANIATARSGMAGCDAGQAIIAHTTNTDDRASLWGAVCHMRRVWAAYDRAMAAPPRYAKSLNIMPPPDPMTTSADAPAFDTRTDEEKTRAAISAWTTCQFWLRHAPRLAHFDCIISVVDEAGMTNPAGVMQALQCVADGLAGRKIARSKRL